ncbi:Crp family transcriptional regulator [Bifidobacterium actinocoloniiforme DSM 22766]|uniref:Crp family transcriptional regulator n=1 Tax=Bifidobacterium actinocoloniiforme DSM 22766 TaxID=1437605 RepID=A0A086YZE1_9BIFI|nr:Crp/Fnr family transcriptional regulator [Bifidobacterium actinocoloniiforme]AKV54979.1 Crp/Fnr family transcriptional regulator [Bifidobacterium actinocoloniiforme DSM 22766]KFI39641.1 Crp family transcriptional regulator [Bifidobacterium actinocoloniiforme DSM 22766]
MVRKVNEIANEDSALLLTPLFEQVPRSEADQLLGALKTYTLPKGASIFRQGDTDHRMYMLERGRVKLVRQSSDHRVQLLSIHGRGEILGEIPVFDPSGGPRTASAVVMVNDTKVAALERDDLFTWLNQHPRVAVDMLQVLAGRLRANNERISDLVFMDVPGRLAKTLIDLATRFGEPFEKGLMVPHDLTQEELAQLVGASRETVNKALMDFSNRKWISRKGRTIIIYHPGALIRRSRM